MVLWMISDQALLGVFQFILERLISNNEIKSKKLGRVSHCHLNNLDGDIFKNFKMREKKDKKL